MEGWAEKSKWFFILSFTFSKQNFLGLKVLLYIHEDVTFPTISHFLLLTQISQILNFKTIETLKPNIQKFFAHVVFKIRTLSSGKISII